MPQTLENILIPTGIMLGIALLLGLLIVLVSRIFAVEKNETKEKMSLLPLEMNACLPGCVWNAAPRSLSPLERNIGFWTQA